ncbi:hypothetical protein BX265_1743 [Streptomyces sp. TLI_235]|nr:hypothetical protein BX265_1743 [Streptomyces sp. TLI_235]
MPPTRPASRARPRGPMSTSVSRGSAFPRVGLPEGRPSRGSAFPRVDLPRADEEPSRWPDESDVPLCAVGHIGLPGTAAVPHVEGDGRDDDLRQGTQRPPRPSRESVVQETVAPVSYDDLREAPPGSPCSALLPLPGPRTVARTAPRARWLLRMLGGDGTKEDLAGPGTVDGHRIFDCESLARERYQHELAVVLQEDRDVPATDRTDLCRHQRSDGLRRHLVSPVQEPPQQPFTESLRPVRRRSEVLPREIRHEHLCPLHQTSSSAGSLPCLHKDRRTPHRHFPCPGMALALARYTSARMDLAAAGRDPRYLSDDFSGQT